VTTGGVRQANGRLNRCGQADVRLWYSYVGNNGPRANRISHLIPRAIAGMTALLFGHRTSRHRTRGTAEGCRSPHPEARKKMHDVNVEIGVVASCRSSSVSFIALRELIDFHSSRRHTFP